MTKKKESVGKKVAFLLMTALLAGMVAGNGNDLGKVHAAGPTPSVTSFATKEELQAKFDCDGVDDTVGRLCFGKNAYGGSQMWYIAGTDSDVSGNNIVLFAAEPILGKSKTDGTTIEGQMFKAPTTDQYGYEAGWNCQYPNNVTPSQVNRNHYGGSDLRAKLQEIAESESYFTKAEQSLMNATPVETLDTLNNVTYTTTDKLYALSIWDVNACPAIYVENKQIINEFTEPEKIYAGSGNDIGIATKKYSGTTPVNSYWLRSPATHMYGEGSYSSLQRQTHYYVAYVSSTNQPISTEICSSGYVVKPAANLNLTNVLFASAAKAASQEPVSGTIGSEAPMALRLNEAAYGKTIGTVGYDESQGLIVAQKGTDVTGTVSLVVQGNDGSDWYYSVTVDGAAVVTKEQIKAALGIPEVTFADCRIWLETTADNVAYATALATEFTQAEQITKEIVTEVNLTGVKPVGGITLGANSTCTTRGIAEKSPVISYTVESGGNTAPAAGIAEWDTMYGVDVILHTTLEGRQAYVFADQVAVRIDGYLISDLHPDVCGRLQITQKLATDKRKITGITAPDAPENGIFSNYYTATDVLTNGGNSELGTQATVTLEGTAEVAEQRQPVDVEWTLDGGTVYDATPDVVNTFRWTVKPNTYQDYGRDDIAMTGICMIANRAATPVEITGNDESLYFNGKEIDVSQYFTIDPNAGTAIWSLEPGGTGAGTLKGAALTVTQTGTFLIKVSTAANGIYGAGEKRVTLTVLPVTANGNNTGNASEDDNDSNDGQQPVTENVNPVGKICRRTAVSVKPENKVIEEAEKIFRTNEEDNGITGANDQQEKEMLLPAPTEKPAEAITVPAGNTDTDVLRAGESNKLILSYAMAVGGTVIGGAAIGGTCVIRRKRGK